MYHQSVAPAPGGLPVMFPAIRAGTRSTFAISFVERVRRYLGYRRDYRALMDMPDYLLRDIGLSREEVVAADARVSL